MDGLLDDWHRIRDRFRLLLAVHEASPFPIFVGEGLFSVQPMEPESVTRRFL